jgi:hypothetical protein
VFRLLFLLWTFCLHAPDQTSIYFGDEAREILQLNTDEIGETRDIAYEKQTHRLFIYSKLKGRYHLRCWSLQGDLLADWLLPQTLETWTILFRKDRTLRAILSDKARPLPTDPPHISLSWQKVEASFSEGPPSSLELKDLKEWTLTNETALNPAIAKTMRSAMKQLEFESEFPYLGHSTHAQSNPQLVPIHAQSLYDYVVGWNEDLSLLAFGWYTLSNTTVARKTGAGSYRPIPLEDLLHSVRLFPPEEAESLTVTSRYLKSVVLGKEIAVFGIEGERHKNRTYRVIWVDLHSDTPKIIRDAEGLLARRLENY